MARVLARAICGAAFEVLDDVGGGTGGIADRRPQDGDADNHGREVSRVYMANTATAHAGKSSTDPLQAAYWRASPLVRELSPLVGVAVEADESSSFGGELTTGVDALHLAQSARCKCVSLEIGRRRGPMSIISMARSDVPLTLTYPFVAGPYLASAGRFTGGGKVLLGLVVIVGKLMTVAVALQTGGSWLSADHRDVSATAGGWLMTPLG